MIRRSEALANNINAVHSGRVRTVFLDVQFLNAIRGWAVGENGVILCTLDGGINWEIMNKITMTDFYDIDFADRRNGWTVGKVGVIANTVDGGQNWMLQESGTRSQFWGVDFVSSTTGWAVGELAHKKRGRH